MGKVSTHLCRYFSHNLNNISIIHFYFYSNFSSQYYGFASDLDESKLNFWLTKNFYWVLVHSKKKLLIVIVYKPTYLELWFKYLSRPHEFNPWKVHRITHYIAFWKLILSANTKVAASEGGLLLLLFLTYVRSLNFSQRYFMRNFFK